MVHFQTHLTTIHPHTTTVDIHLEVPQLVAVLIHGTTPIWHPQKFLVLSNLDPFYLKFIRGNIRTCQGCRGSLRASDSSIPDAPNDLCIAHAEKRPYRDYPGVLVTPSTYKPSRYHAQLACIRAVEPSFMPHCLSIPPDIFEQLT